MLLSHPLGIGSYSFGLIIFSSLSVFGSYGMVLSYLLGIESYSIL